MAVKVDRRTRPAAANRLRAARLAAGMTQRQVASALGWTLACFGFYEQGRRRITDKMAERIALVLGCEPSVILGASNPTT